MPEKDTALSEMARQLGQIGGTVRSERHREKIVDWGASGGKITAKRYGKEHYQRMQRLSAERRKKKASLPVPSPSLQCKKCGVRMDGDFSYLQSEKHPSLCMHCE